jgi:uncharacterized protein (DUF433 family)
MQAVTTTHILLDENGVAWIDDTNVKVIEVVLDKMAHGSSPEEMAFQYPHLSLSQIHAALAYYYDHQPELDADIERRHREANEILAKASDPVFRQELLARKKAYQRNGRFSRIFRRKNAGDTWHWCENCSTWPTSDYEEKTSKPTIGEFCNECKLKDKAGNCLL